MALNDLMMYDGMAPLKAFEAGKQSGLARLAVENRQKLGQVLASGDYMQGAKSAYGMGMLDEGSALARLAAQEQEAAFKQQQQQQTGEALAKLLGPQYAGLASSSPGLATQVYSADQSNALKMSAAERDALRLQMLQDAAGKKVLSPGQVIVDGSNKIIASAPAKPKERALTSVDKNAILEADGLIETNKGTIAALNKALEINPKAGSGALANAQSFAARNDPTGLFDKNKGEATTNFNNLIMNDALSGMKAIFGGNPTEGERAILLELQASVDKSPKERKAIIDRAIKRAELRLKFNENKAKELRSGNYFGEASNVDPIPEDQSGYLGADGITSQDIGGLTDGGPQYPDEAIQMLTQDPSPEARQEFDGIFGDGASKRVLGQ